MTHLFQKLETEITAARNLLYAMHDDLDGDAQLVADTIEGETQLLEVVRQAVERLGEIEALHFGLQKYIEAQRARADGIEKRAKAIRQSLVPALQVMGVSKLTLAQATLSIRAGQPRVEIVSEAMLPPEFMIQPPPAPDKAAIGKALKAGIDVPGAGLMPGSPTLTVRVK